MARMTSPPRAYLPDLLYAGGEVRSGAALCVKEGSVTAVGDAPAGFEPVRLAGAAVLPGLVSAHSHAFQRALRGWTEPRGGAEDFWGWREAMYRVASSLDPEELFAVARLAFQEMAGAGVTAVGEFHYLHRAPGGRPYADPHETARQLARAAREVGLRLALLRGAYARAGPGEAPSPAQRRFVEPSPDDALRALDDLDAELCRRDPLVSLGLAPHSVRACPADWIERLAAEARRRRLPLHLHVAEQPAEVERCRAEHGVGPVELRERLGARSPATTAVHAIHLAPPEIALLGRSGATVCACPTTERDLGDGVVPADRLLAAGARLALGTDANGQIDLLEDARELEYHLRLLALRRGILGAAGAASGEPVPSLAARLYGFASAGGMASRGLTGGTLAPGEPADFVVVRLDDASVAGSSERDLLATVVASMARSAVRDVYVAGEPVVEDGAPAAGRAGAEEARRAFAAALARLRG